MHKRREREAESGVSLRPNSAPTLPLLHVTFLLSGFGTMLLGPILPLLSTRWQLTDAQTGLLLLAQFCGATLGGATVSYRLTRDLAAGLAAAAVGFLVFALAPGLLVACTGLVLGGLGVGRMIAAGNILGGQRASIQRGSALARLNFSWSLGALLSPLLASWLLPHFILRALLERLSALFFIVGGILFLQMRGGTVEERERVNGSIEPSWQQLRKGFFYFVALLFLYGGLETCLSGWLTTYALRFGRSSLMLSEYAMVLLLIGLTGGRALAAWLLLKIQERTVMRVALLLTAVLTCALGFAHQTLVIAVLAVLLGVCIAPVFPASFAVYMSSRPPASQAGLVLAASGLGAAALPWLMGLISTQSGSLRVALAVPAAAALALLAQSLFGPFHKLRAAAPATEV